jgi:hypothetical protein
VAFEVSATPEAPLEGFVFDRISIAAQKAGKIADARNFSLTRVSIRTVDNSRLAFTDSRGLDLKDDSGITPAPQP